MPPRPHNDKPTRRREKPKRSLATRLDRLAAGLNPLLAIVALGLLILNLTVYVGLEIAHHPPAASAALPVAVNRGSGAADGGN